ncbi:adenylate/guanylate cyclase domain-containing protein [Rothia aerolata]|uniref:Adenylate cyclase n=1 Tax=Rothia aerolata TaxID=1812262 RepID=A0A917ISS9_9MICC|nr:adenylate/guanylate cyclase domain-containing protein [Rothia aerolata]GGH63216.1 adenylate cyclase [Rothia aerolata]
MEPTAPREQPSSTSSDAPVSDQAQPPKPAYWVAPNPVQDNLYRSEEDLEAVRHLEQVLLGEERSLKRREAAEAAEVSLLSARKIWRALGMPNLTDQDTYFTPADSQALKDITALVRDYGITEEGTMSLTRSVGQMTDRMVAWQVEALVEDMVTHRGISDSQARHDLLKLLPELIEQLEQIVLYGYRRQLNAAVLRLALRGEKQGGVDPAALPLARGIGFADLVSYTSLSRQMNEKTLAGLVQSFEQRCAEVVAVGGGRIIKTVGDEVLFLAETPEAAARISLTLSKLIKEDPNLPEARVAFVWGRILPKLGDVYGPTVNLASRLVALAEPGVVLTDDATAEILDDNEEFVLNRLETRNVRGFGDVCPVAITPGVGNELEIDFV